VSKYTQYVFKPRDEIADWIDENILDENGNGWTGWCYDKIYNMQRKQYQHRIDKLGFRVLIVLMGMILVSFSYLVTNIWNYVLLVSGGMCIIVIGFIMVGLEVKNERK